MLISRNTELPPPTSAGCFVCLGSSFVPFSNLWHSKLQFLISALHHLVLHNEHSEHGAI